MRGRKGKELSVAFEITFAFFLGGAVSSLAQDPSDVIFFYASSKGPLSTNSQLFYWYFVPFLVYIFFAVLAYALGRFTAVRATIVFWLYLFAVLVSTVFSFLLPQASSDIFIGTIFLATFVSVFIIWGMLKRVARHGMRS